MKHAPAKPPRLWRLGAGLATLLIVGWIGWAGIWSARVTAAQGYAPAAEVTPTATDTDARVFLPWMVHRPPPTAMPPPTPGPTRTPGPIDPTLSQYGLVFANSAETLSGDARLQRGADTGARWDRFPFYWSDIERSAGQFDWSKQDAAVRADEAHGMQVLAILLGTPGQYWTATNDAAAAGSISAPPIGGSFYRSLDRSRAPQAGPPPPQGLYNAIFSDGTDTPGPGKTVSPNNPWARFVDLVVKRYRPGGMGGFSVRHWEIWNEPDLLQFWTGSAEAYARLLKVAYLVAKSADPGATIVWGGLAHFENPTFLDKMLSELKADPMATQYNNFFDGAGSHHYAVSWNSYAWTDRIRQALKARGWSDKPIWITESGVPICSDFPFPGDCPSPWRASPEEQASYIWQNIAYTRLAGGGPIFQFSLHDDCGNVVAPDSPDGFGLVKNESGSYCSPHLAEKRLSYRAFQLANQYFVGTELLWNDIVSGAVRRVAFYDPASGERRLLVWSITTSAQTATIPATGSNARLIALDGSEATLTPVGDAYSIALPGATNRNQPSGDGYELGIYGKPYLLIEHDAVAPATAIEPLPATSPSSFTVTWHASDPALGSGIESVTLWYQVGGGAWRIWSAGRPANGSLTFSGMNGERYGFSATAEDRAGNHSIGPSTQAETLLGEQSQAYPVTGDVVNNGGAPVANATVKLGLTPATTDRAGNFALSVTPGRWDVSVNERVVEHGRLISGGTALALLQPPLANSVGNGDFAAGLAGWQAGGSGPLQIEGRPGTLDYALRLGSSFVPNPGVPGQDGSSGCNSTASQAVQMPGGRPYLALEYAVDSQETERGHDKFEIIVIDSERSDYLHSQETSSAARFLTLDMSGYAGKRVTLVFNVYQASPLRPSSALVSMVSIGVP